MIFLYLILYMSALYFRILNMFTHLYSIRCVSHDLRSLRLVVFDHFSKNISFLCHNFFCGLHSTLLKKKQAVTPIKTQMAKLQAETVFQRSWSKHKHAPTHTRLQVVSHRDNYHACSVSPPPSLRIDILWDSAGLCWGQEGWWWKTWVRKEKCEGKKPTETTEYKKKQQLCCLGEIDYKSCCHE